LDFEPFTIIKSYPGAGTRASARLAGEIASAVPAAGRWKDSTLQMPLLFILGQLGMMTLQERLKEWRVRRR